MHSTCTATSAEQWTWEKAAQPLLTFAPARTAYTAITPPADARAAELEAALAERGRYSGILSTMSARHYGAHQQQRGIMAQPSAPAGWAQTRYK
ncbi:MAG: hypothetical protein U0074_08575 [Kouleothrix sp.]